MPRILRLSLRSFCSSSVSNEPSSTSLPANGSTLKAIGLANFSGAGNATAAPSWVSSRGPVDDLADLLVELVDAGEPGARRRPGRCWRSGARRPASSCSGLSTGIAAIVVQLGLAMMPLRALAIVAGLTSLTTSGTSGSIRHADELSMTMAPAAANRGASSRDEVAPAENRAMSRPRRIGGRGVLDGDLACPSTAAWCRPTGPRRSTGSRRPGSSARRAAGA